MKIITFVFDAIFPPRTTELVVRGITPGTISKKYLLQHHQNTICLSSYSDGQIKALITENKYHQNPAAAKYLANLLEQWVVTQTLPIVLIPIPLSKQREKERGYNQVMEVINNIKATKTLSLNGTLLQRTRHTAPQTSLQKDERLKNLTGAFVCDIEKTKSYENCVLVLVDDVATTGATLAAARAELQPNLHPTTKLICLALAH